MGRGGALSGDSCCPVEFICEHYLTFSKSLLRVIIYLLSQKAKKKRVFDRGNGELENSEGSEHEYIFTFKMAFRMLSNCLLTASRAEGYSVYEMKMLRSQYYRTSYFTASTMTSTRKCLSHSGLCRLISAILCMLNGCSVLVARKLLPSVTNEPNEIQL